MVTIVRKGVQLLYNYICPFFQDKVAAGHFFKILIRGGHIYFSSVSVLLQSSNFKFMFERFFFSLQIFVSVISFVISNGCVLPKMISLRGQTTRTTWLTLDSKINLECSAQPGKSFELSVVFHTTITLPGCRKLLYACCALPSSQTWTDLGKQPSDAATTGEPHLETGASATSLIPPEECFYM